MSATSLPILPNVFCISVHIKLGGGGSKVDGIEMEQLEIIEITNFLQVSRLRMSPDNYLEEDEGFLYDLMRKL